MIPWNPIKRIDMFHDTNVFNPYLQESFSVHPSWSHSHNGYNERKTRQVPSCHQKVPNLEGIFHEAYSIELFVVVVNPYLY